MTSTDTVERVAKAMAFAVKQPNDACTSEDEYWLHTGQLGQETWKQAARAAISARPSPDVGDADQPFEIPSGGAYFMAGGDRFHISLDGTQVKLRVVEIEGFGTGMLFSHQPAGNVINVEAELRRAPVKPITADWDALSTPPKEDV